jgi:protein-tyrosine phosphatase
MESGYRVCFVCTGNICRSPAAEVILRELAERERLLGLEVDSAGTGDWHVGQPADPRAVRALATAGFDGQAHRARQFDREWFARRDLIVALDRGHARTLRSLAPDDQARSRIRLLRSFDPSVLVGEDHPDIDVADPYYDGDGEFRAMLVQIQPGAAGLLEHVRPRLARPA